MRRQHPFSRFPDCSISSLLITRPSAALPALLLPPLSSLSLLAPPCFLALPLATDHESRRRGSARRIRFFSLFVPVLQGPTLRPAYGFDRIRLLGSLAFSHPTCQLSDRALSLAPAAPHPFSLAPWESRIAHPPHHMFLATTVQFLSKVLGKRRGTSGDAENGDLKR